MSNIVYNSIYFTGNEDGYMSFINEIKTSNKWIPEKNMDSKLKIFLPEKSANSKNKYFLFYNKTTNEYNLLPTNDGNYHIYSLSFDYTEKVLKIVDCNFNYKKN